MTATADRPVRLLSNDQAAEIWSRALQSLSGMVVEQAKRFCRLEVVPPNRLVIAFRRASRSPGPVASGHVQRFEQAWPR